MRGVSFLVSVDESAVPAPVGWRHELGDREQPATGTVEFDVISEPEQTLASRLPLAPSGRHVASGRSEGHGRRFTIFGLIGAAIFVMGLAMQAVLTGKWHMAPDASYVTQGVISIELSFLLNRWLTWRDRDVQFWPAFGRYNLQKTVTSVLNLAAYAGLVWLGMNYLVANIVLVGVFSAINYVAGDVLVFTRLRGAHRPSATPRTVRSRSPQLADAALAGDSAAIGVAETTGWLPTVSVVIPCKASQRTIRSTVQAMLAQDYPNLLEVICVGDVDDPSWDALEDIYDGRLVIVEHQQRPGTREPNAKRDEGALKSAGEVIALADSDIVMDPGWLSCAVALLDGQGREGLVAGGMRSAHDSFWGAFVDTNQLAAKTPRLPRPYRVTDANFGKRGFKPPITANAVFVRELYDRTPLDVEWSYGYEDYEWFWRIVRDGHKVLFSEQLTGAHHHRRSFHDLAKEYRLSAEGCARFVRAYGDCPLARKRLMQAVVLPLALVAGLAGVGLGLAHHIWLPTLAAIFGCWVLLTCREVVRARTPWALMYPFVAVPLGVLYTFALGRELVMSRPQQESVIDWAPVRETRQRPSFETRPRPPLSRPPSSPRPARQDTGEPEDTKRLYWPLVGVLAVQAAMSLSLVWSNTAFGDEGTYLWQGRLEWAHWLHGAPLPAMGDSGIPQFYPAIGALASAIGGLAAARILSLCFMLAATVLLYLIGSRLFGRPAGVAGAALWGVSEPVLRLAFATFDPLSCFLIIAALWIATQAGVRRRCGELVFLSAVTLALASATAFSFAIYIPSVIVIAFFIWTQSLGRRLAIWCASWMSLVTALAFLAILTIFHGWVDFIGSTITRNGTSQSLGAGLAQIFSSAWSWDGLIAALALAGVFAAFHFERSVDRRLLVLALAVGGTIVVAYQARLGSAWSMDKHVSAGTGFMSIAAGYAFSRVRFSWQRGTAWLVGAALLSFPAITGLWYARSTFHSWPNDTALVNSLSRDPHNSAFLILGAPDGVFASVQYALPSSTVTETAVPQSLINGSYAAVVLTFNGQLGNGKLNRSVLQLAAANGSSSAQLTNELEHSNRYHMTAAIRYSTTFSGNGVFVVWQRTSPTT
jgi:putative flippase GtrA/GT2 family glycosyltransferase